MSASTNVSLVFQQLLKLSEPGLAASAQPPASSPDVISALHLFDFRLYIGTEKGELVLYTIEHTTDPTATGTSKYLLHVVARKSVGKKPVDAIIVTESSGGGEFLVVQCGGVVTIHTLIDLALLYPVPVKGALMFACNNTSYMGLAIATSSSLKIFDIASGFENSRTYNVPEAPKSIAWTRNLLCLAFEEEYNLIVEETGAVSLLSDTQYAPKPYVVPLPTEDLLMIRHKSILVSDLSGKHKSIYNFMNQPTSVAFSFPFMFAICSNDTIEVRSIIDGDFHEVLRIPTATGKATAKVFDDGRTVVVATGDTVFVLQPQINKKNFAEALGLRRSFESMTDRAALVQFVTTLLSSDASPYRQLMVRYISRFIKRYPSPESTDLEECKKHMATYLRRLYKTVTLYFKEFKEQVQKELVYLGIQVVFFRYAYGIINAIVRQKCIEDDTKYMTKLRTLKGVTLGDLGVRVKFFLNAQTLAGERRKEKDASSDAPLPPMSDSFAGSPGDRGSVLLPALPPNFVPFADATLISIPKPDNVTNFVSDDTFDGIRGTPVTLALDVDSAMHLVNKSTGIAAPLSIGNQLVFDEEAQAVRWVAAGRAFKLSLPARDSFNEFCTTFRLYEAIAPSSSAAAPSQLSSSSLFIGAGPNLSGSMLQSSSSDKLSASRPTDIPKARSPSVGGRADAGSFSPGDIPLLGTPTRPDAITPVPLWPTEEFSVSSPDAPRSPKPSRSLSPDEETERNDPYYVPIRILRAISQYRSPREKVECILRALKQTAQTVSDFWAKIGKSVVLGADDLVPIFIYVTLKAQVKNVYTEQMFVMEFASESSLRGKYGYALATLQIAVESLLRIEPKKSPETELSSSSGSIDINDFEMIGSASPPKSMAREKAQAIIKHVESINLHSIDKHQNVTAAGGTTGGFGVSGSVTQRRLDNKAVQKTFNLPASQAIATALSCCIETAKSNPGWLYLTQDWVCFQNSSGPMKGSVASPAASSMTFTKLTFKLESVSRMKKSFTVLNTLPVIEIVTDDSKVYRFLNFVNRDEAFGHLEKALAAR